MRKLIWVALGFGLACAICAYLLIPKVLILPAVLLSAILLAVSRNRIWVRKAGLLLMGFGLGLSWSVQFHQRILEPIYELDGIAREVQIRCVDYGENTDYGIRTEGRMRIEDHTYSVQIYLNEDTAVEPGTLLSGPFLFKITAPGGMKESVYFQGEGIYLLAYQQDDLAITVGEMSWRDLPAELHQRILITLKNAMPADTAPFAKALLMGDTSDLSYGTLTDFTVSGIRHIVAVSGLHVSVLFGLLSFISFRKRFLSAVITIPVLFLFAAVTGFTPSVCRACTMCALMRIAALLNREYDGPSALAFSGLALLIINPLVITSVSYQLSFASVAGIFLFSPGIRQWVLSIFHLKRGEKLLSHSVNWLAASVSVTLGATVATLPLCAVYFGVISLAAVLTNLLVLWAVSFIFYGIMAVCFLGAFWMPGALAVGKGISVLIRFVLKMAEIIGNCPLSAIYTGSPYVVAWLVFVYILLGLFFLAKDKNPASLVCCIVIGLCVSLLGSWLAPLTDDVRFTVLDVGQGQSLLLQTAGRCFLVDCGGSSDSEAADKAAEALLSQGVSYLDGLILTHYDRDHSGGVENLLSRIDVGLMILPSVYTELQLEAEEILYAEENLTLTAADAKIQIFASETPGVGNENSLCILFDTKDCDILITGDRDGFGERMLLRTANIPDVDVLIAGHHGSKYSVCEELLDAVQPEIVCISAGIGNSFGHPAPEVLERLARFGCEVYRTDLHGDIIIRR